MKKKLLFGAIAFCLVAIMAFGTLSYFTGSSSVTNKFMVASSEDDPSSPTDEQLFSVSVTETTGDEYKGAYPGKIYDKDPTVTNTSENDDSAQWIRVQVTFDNAQNWLDADETFTAANLFDKIVTDVEGSGFVATDWKRVDPEEIVDDKLVYTFYYIGGEDGGQLLPGKSVTLFKKVGIPSSLEVDDMVSLSTFSITVKADAIQSMNTGASAEATFTDPAYWTED